MATRVCSNGQSLFLQQGPSYSPVTSSSRFFNGNYDNGTGGLDYRAMETYLPPNNVPRQNLVGPPEVRPCQEWQQKRRRLRRICLFALLFVLNIVVSVAVSLFVPSFVSLPATSKAKENQRTICIPCSVEDSKAVDARRLSSTAEDASKGHLCCASGDDDAQMKELVLEGIKQSLQERLKGEELYNLLNNPLLPTPINRNAAHVFLKLAGRQHVTHKQRTSVAEDMVEEYELLRDWSSEGNTAFIRQGIAFNASSGHFKVKDAGIYVIYSRIVFEDDDKEEEDESDDLMRKDRGMVFGHAISSYSYNRYRELLEDEQLSDCMPGGIVCYNSRIFSTLHLTKDATIAVRVRKSNFVSQKSHTSYFGLYKID